MMRLPLLALVAAASVLGLNSAHAASATQGDAAHGKTLVYTCAGCHGVPGYENAYPNYRVPRIAGQKQAYIIKALHEYRSGDRKHPTMHAQASSLSDQEIMDIAAYLSSLAIPDAKLAKATDPVPPKAMLCTSCHGKHGQAEVAGADPTAPRLAGQYQNFMAQALHEYKSGQRSNPIMKGMVTTLTEADIENITMYFSRQPTKLSTLKYHIQGSSEMGVSN